MTAFTGRHEALLMALGRWATRRLRMAETDAQQTGQWLEAIETDQCTMRDALAALEAAAPAPSGPGVQALQDLLMPVSACGHPTQYLWGAGPICQVCRAERAEAALARLRAMPENGRAVTMFASTLGSDGWELGEERVKSAMRAAIAAVDGPPAPANERNMR